MRKVKDDCLIVGYGSKPREYVINGVRYIVSAQFTSGGADEKTLAERLQGYVQSDIAELQIETGPDMLEEEYACSAAGEED